MTLRSSIRRLAPVLLVCTGLLTFAPGGSAEAAQAPWWHINYETVPGNLPPGGEGQIIVVLSNLGDSRVDGTTNTVNISTKLPPGLTATNIESPPMGGAPVQCSLATLQCSSKGTLNPYERIAVNIRAKAEEPSGTVASLPVEASVEGGGAAKVSATHTVTVSGEPSLYGLEDYEFAPFNEDGTPATQAGAHPFQLTTTLTFDQKVFPGATRQPIELPKDLSFSLPPGLVGNPTAVAQCTMANFFALVKETNLCAPSSVVGVATVTASEPIQVPLLTKTVPVFNLVPAQGEPARFGLEVIGKIPIVIDTSVRSGRDYGVDASVQNATQAGGLLSSQVTFWGVPGDPRHNNARGWECVAGGAYAAQVKKSCPEMASGNEQPFLISPSACAADPGNEPVTFPMETASWANPTTLLGAEYTWMTTEGTPLGFQGCNNLPFTPQILSNPPRALSKHPHSPLSRRPGPPANDARSRSPSRVRPPRHNGHPAGGSPAVPLSRQWPRGLLRVPDRLPRLQRLRPDQRILN